MAKMVTSKQVVVRAPAPAAAAANQALAMFDPANIPGHIVKFNEENTNIADKLSVDSLTYKGKVWTVNIGGNKTPLMKTNDEGDVEPRGTIQLVILGYNDRRGRSYYDTGFDDEKPKQPTCWSPDGITPDPSSIELQAEKCANCPMSVKGSKVTDNNSEGIACQGYRLTAVQLYQTWPEIPPLRLRLAVTSDWDGNNKENEANGWYAFSNLMDFLRSRGVKHTASAIVKAKFDPSVAYPKVLFSPIGWITEDDEAFLAPLATSPDVQALLSQKYTPAGGDNVRKDKVGTKDDPAITGPTGGKAEKTTKSKPVVAKKPEPEPDPEPEVAEYVDENGNPCDAEGNPLEAEANPDAAGDEPVQYVDENGNPCDAEGNPLPTNDPDATSVIEGAEADDDDPEVAAKKAADEARARAAAKQEAKVTAAANQARTSKAQPADDEGAITLGKPVPPTAVQTGRPTVVNAKQQVATQAKPSLAPNKAPAATVVAKGGNGKATVTVAPKTGAAAAGKPGKAGPTPVGGKVGAMLQDWQDD